MEPIPIVLDGVERRYVFASAVGAAQLVVALPGKGATAAWADEDAGWSAAFLCQGFALAIPEALPPDPTKPPKFLTNPPRWDDGAVSSGRWAVGSQDDVAFLAAVIADATGRMEIEPRACVTGFSNGAAMAFRFAAERADIVTALAPVAGHCWTDAKPSRPVPTLYLIGTADPLVPLEGGPVRMPWADRVVTKPPVAQTLAKWAAAIGDPALLQVQYLAGHGHHWPGGRGGLGERLGGPNTAHVSANDTIAEFFRRHAA